MTIYRKNIRRYKTYPNSPFLVAAHLELTANWSAHLCSGIRPPGPGSYLKLGVSEIDPGNSTAEGSDPEN